MKKARLKWKNVVLQGLSVGTARAARAFQYSDSSPVGVNTQLQYIYRTWTSLLIPALLVIQLHLLPLTVAMNIIIEFVSVMDTWWKWVNAWNIVMGVMSSAGVISINAFPNPIELYLSTDKVTSQ